MAAVTAPSLRRDTIGLLFACSPSGVVGTQYRAPMGIELMTPCQAAVYTVESTGR